MVRRLREHGRRSPCCQTHVEQIFTPYGESLSLNYTIDGSSGQTLDPDDGVNDVNEAPWTLRGFQGYYYDAESGLWYARGRYYIPSLGRFASVDPIGTGLITIASPIYGGMAMRPNAWVRPLSQYTDGLSLYQFVRSNPITRNDPMGLFSYTELTTTMGIQGVLGGFVNGAIAKFAGQDFWNAFAQGAIGGALGGAGGFAFQAGRAGFLGSVVLGRAAEGFAGSAGTAFYNGEDFKSALVDGLYGAGMSVATGGAISVGKRGLQALGAVKAGSRFMRPGSIRPNAGPGSLRDDLAHEWGLKTAPPGYHAHHMFPLEFADRFRTLGIEPDDVRFGAWWDAAGHEANQKAYSRFWQEFLYPKRGAAPSPDEILDAGRKLAKRYNLSIMFGE